jgi:hypothetical protein
VTRSSAVSAVRFSGESFWEAYLRNLGERPQDLELGDSVQEVARPFAQLDFSRVEQWQSEDQLHAAFLKIRDERFLRDPGHDVFPRRLTWLYPDDGSHVRAALMDAHFSQWGLKRPSKIFVIGNLKLYTRNSLRGSVSWWFHVAPIVTVKGKAWVIDPAVDPERELEVSEWISRFGDVNEVRVSLCMPGTYTPYDSCVNPPLSAEQEAFTAVDDFLEDEWFRLTELGRKPELELGDSPTWLHRSLQAPSPLPQP